MDIKFRTFRELKEAIDQVPGHLLDNDVRLCDSIGNLVTGGTLTTAGGAVHILEGE